MARINLDDGYYIESDPHQWRVVNKFGKGVSYHTELVDALESYVKLRIRKSSAEGVPNILKMIKSLKIALDGALRGLPNLVIIVKEPVRPNDS